jgi:hypothetical protein
VPSGTGNFPAGACTLPSSTLAYGKGQTEAPWGLRVAEVENVRRIVSLLNGGSEMRDTPIAGISISLVAAVLLCLAVFAVPLSATGPGEPSSLPMANSPRVDQGANGNGHPLDGTYLFVVSAEEAEDAEKAPINAELLTMLLLAASSFGTRQGVLLCSLGVVRPSLATAREDPLFLGVFRL